MMVNLDTFQTPLKAAVIGAGGGIGRAFTHLLAHHAMVGSVHTFSRKPDSPPHQKIHPVALDFYEEESVFQAALLDDKPYDLIIVATGLLHRDGIISPEKTWATLDPDAMLEVFRANTIGPALVAKHFLPRLSKNSKSVFAVLSARVGSISDNRLGGWVSYRASKAALNQVVKTLSIELARKNKQGIMVGLHPGTVATNLSAPFQGNVPEGKLFPPERSATHLLNVINGLSQEDSGGCFAWDGQRIPA